jgi:hypothetical protein
MPVMTSYNSKSNKMKKIFLCVALIAASFLQSTYAQDSSIGQATSQLLSLYYNIKDALVAGNATETATSAAAFTKELNGVDYKVISEGNITILVKDAAKIAATKDLNKQREYFANLSTNMASVAKVVKLSDKPIYQAYCPMKKAAWLSNEKAIKNPYYGSAMLTCGEITETIQK